MTTVAGTAPVERRRHGFDVSKPVLFAFAIILFALIAMPLSWLIYYAFTNKAGAFTLANFHRLVSDAAYVDPLMTTFALATLSALICCVVAAPMGWLVARTDMELGGHSPVVVFEDADPEKTADTIAAFKYRNAGQVCISPTRFYVHENNYKKFVARFTEYAKGLKLGDGLEKGITLGPLANPRRLDAMIGHVGADRVVLGSDYPYDMGMLDCVKHIRGLKISDADKNTILGTRAEALLAGKP